MDNAATGNTETGENLLEQDSLTPEEIVRELDKYIIAQEDAKRAVAVALRNRWRRLKVEGSIKEEITPKNIILIGPTGVGKTEITRRLAKLVRAPFVKVEATKFTEVGYVGRDVESIIRDLVEHSVHIVKEEERKKVRKMAEEMAEERLLDVLLPSSARRDDLSTALLDSESENEGSEELKADDSMRRSREKLREMLRAGRLEERIVEIEIEKSVHTSMQILGPAGFSEIEGQIKDMFSNMIPRQKERRKVKVKEARKILSREAEEDLIDHDRVAQIALKRAEQTGIVFIDEIDKIAVPTHGKGPDVSREGVQRDLLPLIEGCTVGTKYGSVRTDHILFIASGAFHASKPSDLMPEFQGRFPIRVELKSLTSEHFAKILTEPENALTKQYIALLGTEGVKLSFSDDAIQELATLTAEVNSKAENIGARRLYTVMEKLLETISFDAHKMKGKDVVIDKQYVKEHLDGFVEDPDLARFIL
ncbi:MAG: ATP-dependent protease ATPase subunit HslU [Candidatus Dadabacteria bacterium]|nr:MAG: ATP-dependent protease ATPase subunit HslU [Candidatus Dadabacteria bacterium]